MKTALITGAARRLGAHIARTLHGKGYNVAIHYHASEKEAAELCDQLNEQRPHSAMLVCADLTAMEPDTVIAPILNCWGQLDVLVNNAAQFFKTPVGATTSVEWDILFDTNLKAPFFLAQAAFSALKKTQGCIINIIDIHTVKALKNYAVYCMTKTGLVMATRALAVELAPTVRVNGIAPAASAAWPEGANALSHEEQVAIIKKVPLGRAGTLQAISDAVVFFAEQTYITGQILAVDGGRSLT